MDDGTVQVFMTEKGLHICMFAYNESGADTEPPDIMPEYSMPYSHHDDCDSAIIVIM